MAGVQLTVEHTGPVVGSSGRSPQGTSDASIPPTRVGPVRCGAELVLHDGCPRTWACRWGGYHGRFGGTSSLHPFAISRTDVSPNPSPAIVVWLGPAIGCILPLVAFAIAPRRLTAVRNVAGFFAGSCLIANGAYISVGSVDLIGDCGEMFRSGTPRWVMIAFGAVTVPLGLHLWHGLGSLKHLMIDRSTVSPCAAYVLLGELLAAVFVGLALSPR